MYHNEESPVISAFYSNNGEDYLASSVETKDSAGALIAEELKLLKPSQETFARAKKHLTKDKLNQLSSNEPWIRKIAVGKLYEAVIYECLKELTARNPQYSLIAKGTDAPNCPEIEAHPCPDGIFYDAKTGDIVVRGKGQDIAEFDFLLFSEQGELVFIEAKNTTIKLNELPQTVAYKKQLLSYLFGRKPQFILVSPLKIRNDPWVMRTLNMADSYFTCTQWFEEINCLLNQAPQTEHYYPSNYTASLVQASKLKTRELNYLEAHNACLKAIMNSLQEDTEIIWPSEAWLVKRVIVGQLSKVSVEKLLQEKAILVDEKRLSLRVFNKVFGRIILSLSLPELRPALYLKVKSERTYLKLGPINSSSFEFERSIFSRRTAFFNWLESTDREICPVLLNKFFPKFINEKTSGLRRKSGEVERIRKLPWYYMLSKSVEEEESQQRKG
ncbi:MAG: hypothetical protein NWE94_07005 [Candidatus Bathyarchaeota archaeon]|nr:hypothetical protein [Candidatus Bathyarchaeota archaeon]